MNDINKVVFWQCSPTPKWKHRDRKAVWSKIPDKASESHREGLGPFEPFGDFENKPPNQQQK